MIGDPASYPTETDLLGLLKTSGGPFDGWATPRADVKPGHGVQIVDLQMQDELGVQPYHAVQVGLCEHIKAGGSSCGLTAGLMDPLVYELRLSCDAVFEGHVGDIPPVYWAPWRYGFGMALYLRDHPDFMPLFVQTYWTDPEGMNY